MKPALSKIILATTIICIVALSATSCKKRVSSKPQNTDSLPTAIIASSANCAFYRGIPITFNPSPSYAPLGTTFLWSFGDGSTSTVKSPNHTYTVAGTYTVTLTLNGNATPAIHMSIYIVPVPGSHFTQQMGGMRHWVGSADGYTNVFSVSVTMSSVIDNDMPVHVLDSGIVSCVYYNDPMCLSHVDTTSGNYILYADCLGQGVITYYYLRDSMTYLYDGSVNVADPGKYYPRIFMHTQ